MIKSIKHKALNNFWTKGQTKGLNAKWLPKIRRVLDALDAATAPEDMNLPSYRFHQLSGKDANRYSVRVSANYRITFGWDTNGLNQIDLEDYH